MMQRQGVYPYPTWRRPPGRPRNTWITQLDTGIAAEVCGSTVVLYRLIRVAQLYTNLSWFQFSGASVMFAPSPSLQYLQERSFRNWLLGVVSNSNNNKIYIASYTVVTSQRR